MFLNKIDESLVPYLGGSLWLYVLFSGESVSNIVMAKEVWYP